MRPPGPAGRSLALGGALRRRRALPRIEERTRNPAPVPAPPHREETSIAPTPRHRWPYWLGLVLVVVPTATAVYLSQPLPGSQELDSLGFAWHLARVRPWTEIGGGLLLVAGLVLGLRGRGRRLGKAGLVAGALVAAAVVRLAYVEMNPAAWFRPPETIRFATGTSAALPPTTLVAGLVFHGEARAYPIRLLAYHHRVRDRIGGEPVLVTYCTMCRTGKALLPRIAGRELTFDLVGAYRYNSVYADRETGSWWYQANATAAAGPLAGERLPELPVDQMTLGEWLALHPDSLVFQPDPASAAGYTMFGFDGFDARREEPERGERWQWVIGVVRGIARDYPFSVLARERLLLDDLGDLPLALQLRADGISFRVWDRRVDGAALALRLDPEEDVLVDPDSGTRFGFDGVGRGGALDGRRLRQVPATLEYRHSFEGFSGGEPWHPGPAGQP
jgi:Protein of unknown function (DUF3179)